MTVINLLYLIWYFLVWALLWAIGGIYTNSWNFRDERTQDEVRCNAGAEHELVLPAASSPGWS
jgi:hypothetical protein